MAGSNAVALVALILSEGAIGMSAAARLIGTFRDGRPCHPGTLARWAKHGVALPDGRRLRLQTITVNGRLATSRDRLIAFLAAQQQPAAEDVSGDVLPVEGNGSAKRELEAAGLLTGP